MTNRWLDTQTESENRDRVSKYWQVLSEDLDAGTFWADRIKNYRTEPRQRLSIALDNLPLPAAFREGAVALRAIIRAKRKKREDFEEELAFLYRLAALRSFMIDYAPKLKQPGFNVVQSIPGATLQSLPVSYSSLGYSQLELLNKTDCKWFVEQWGEPSKHSTLHNQHKSVWDEYEEKLMEERSEADGELRQYILENPK